MDQLSGNDRTSRSNADPNDRLELIRRKSPQLCIVARIEDLSEALQGFNPLYLSGYLKVHAVAEDFLLRVDDGFDVERAEELARELIVVLRQWKLEHRMAPKARERSDIVQLLLDPEVRTLLARLAQMRTNLPTLVVGRRVVKGDICTPDDLDESVRRVLLRLADGLFEKCSVVTYPMKALLLLTGYSVAFDSQVRDGAQKAGLTGMSRGQLKISDVRRSAALATSRKITFLPYLIGRAWEEWRDLIEAALRATGQEDLMRLVEHPVRVFDIFFFMQAKRGVLLLKLECDEPTAAAWYMQ